MADNYNAQAMNNQQQQMIDDDLGQQQYPPLIQYPQSKADLLDKIKPDLIVEVVRHRLMGEDFVNGEWVIQKQLQDHALTPTGAWDIANLMLSVSSQNVSLSKLNDSEIKERTGNIVRTAQAMCMKNWKKYGIKGIDQLDFVHQIVMSNTFITLKQPEGAGIRKMIMGTTSENRIIQQRDANKDPSSWFSSLIGKGK